MDALVRRALNGSEWVGKRMHCSDSNHPAPFKWLSANAAQFHFSTPELLGAGIEPFDASRRAPRLCGIYFIIERGAITYVGLSKDIQKRIDQHRKYGLVIERISWFEAPEFFLPDIEEYYISRIKPMRNTDKGRRGYFYDLGVALDALAAKSAK